jgi:hypothetical protein
MLLPCLTMMDFPAVQKQFRRFEVLMQLMQRELRAQCNSPSEATSAICHHGAAAPLPPPGSIFHPDPCAHPMCAHGAIAHIMVASCRKPSTLHFKPGLFSWPHGKLFIGSGVIWPIHHRYSHFICCSCLLADQGILVP